MFSPTPSVDGYGDRRDIADAKDFGDAARIAERKRIELTQSEAALDRAVSEWGWASSAQPITEIVLEMIEAECYSIQLLKSEVIWDVESISEAVTEACIQLGLSDEEFAPSYHDLGNEIALRLVG